ncbi:hypothetical protein CORC01_06702 [Colletotrichum orchidophilum]|uniref:Uncharacterized protein n=1 Tax=Colletotrichum orchidophilum TaxID=1209926 RepID=A0A1G4B9I2_9PEZI|nr:uncharacterized protein CORC01_06702 [Colletotrichum orchidophilum]OHE98033.1 hypothetical protein CORC01_06702 [Colletotrichum orchidophilum]
MSSKSLETMEVYIQEKADGSGPSAFFEQELATAMAVTRVSKASTGLIRSLGAFFQFLSSLGIVTVPSSEEGPPELWKHHHEELRDMIMEIYDSADRVLAMALRTDKYLSAGSHEALMTHIYVVREVIGQVLPRELHDSLVGKGKRVAKSD